MRRAASAGYFWPRECCCRPLWVAHSAARRRGLRRGVRLASSVLRSDGGADTGAMSHAPPAFQHATKTDMATRCPEAIPQLSANPASPAAQPGSCTSFEGPNQLHAYRQRQTDCPQCKGPHRCTRARRRTASPAGAEPRAGHHGGLSRGGCRPARRRDAHLRGSAAAAPPSMGAPVASACTRGSFSASAAPAAGTPSFALPLWPPPLESDL